MAQLTTDDFITKARAHWTPEQTKKVTGGKKYPILPGAAPLLLRELGLLNADGSMSADSLRKYSQVNHMLNLLETQLIELAERHKIVRILDAGCGSSFLTLVLAWWFEQRKGNEATSAGRILGIDSNSKLIQKSARTAAILDYEASLKFVAAKLVDFDWAEALKTTFGEDESTSKEGLIARPNMVVALHACDTATDDAIALGIRQQADFIAVAPCCQAELAAQWKGFTQTAPPKPSGAPLGPVFFAPNLRREIASEMTDVLRILLLRGCGYEVTATEFTSSAHTPKNRLISAVRRGRYLDSALSEYCKLRDHLGGGVIKLEGLLPEDIKIRLASLEDK